MSNRRGLRHVSIAPAGLTFACLTTFGQIAAAQDEAPWQEPSSFLPLVQEAQEPELPAQDEAMRKAIESALTPEPSIAPAILSSTPDAAQQQETQTQDSSSYITQALTNSSQLTDIGERRELDPTSPSGSGARMIAKPQRTNFANEPYNIKVGPMKFRFGAALRIEANDNINLSQTDPQPDLIFGPAFGMTGAWQMTKGNVLRLNLGVSYSAYLAHPEYNTGGFDVAPGSEIGFVFSVGDVRMDLHDRFSIERNPVSQPTLSNTANFGRFINNIGITALWNLNKVVLNVGYEHYDDISTQKEFKNLDRTQESIPFAVLMPLKRGLQVGVDGGATLTRYTSKESSLQNSWETHLGPFAEVQIGRYFVLRGAAGIQTIFFDQNQPNTSSEASSRPGWYANLSFQHRVNSWLSQSISLGHENQLGVTVAQEEINFVRYSVSWNLINHVGLSTGLFLQDLTALNEADSQRIQQYGGVIALNYQLTRKMGMNVQYQFIEKDTDLADQGYRQNSFVLQFAYQF